MDIENGWKNIAPAEKFHSLVNGKIILAKACP
jgi:hypothetical protein